MREQQATFYFPCFFMLINQDFQPKCVLLRIGKESSISALVISIKILVHDLLSRLFFLDSSLSKCL